VDLVKQLVKDDREAPDITLRVVDGIVGACQEDLGSHRARGPALDAGHVLVHPDELGKAEVRDLDLPVLYEDVL